MLQRASSAQAVSCALFLLGRTAAGAEAKPEKDAMGDFGASTRVASLYSNNLYHEQRRRETQFDRNTPGERYYEMEGPADLVTEVALDGTYQRPFAKKRDARVQLGARYFFHLKNGIANYFDFAAGGGVDVTTRDRGFLRASFTPRRFKKNYSIREFAGNRFYEHAYFWEIDGRLGWRHRWTKRWKTELAYEPALRRFLTPFKNRDTQRHAGELRGSYDFGKVEVGMATGAAIGRTPSGREFGVPVDRSYRDLRALADAKVSLGSGFGIGADVEYRNRHYTTNEPANESYFARTDQRWAFGVNGRKRFGSLVLLLAEAGFVRNTTNRQDHPDLNAEDLAYEELFARLGVELTL